MTIAMPPGPVSCIGGTKYPIILYCIVPHIKRVTALHCLIIQYIQNLTVMFHKIRVHDCDRGIKL